MSLSDKRLLFSILRKINGSRIINNQLPTLNNDR
jgi:hypothetical protein